MATNTEPQPLSSADLLKERQRLEALFKERFTRKITVMFTDLKDSTALAESAGDMSTRELLEKHNDIVFAAIRAHKGNLVKTMGDGTMSYFEHAQDAQCAAVEIQLALKAYNAQAEVKIPIRVRVGINTGVGIVEENDIYGDVVNVAARFEAQAEAGEIYMSESTYDALENKGECYSRIIKQVRLKGKSQAFEVYKVFWDPAEVEYDKEHLQVTSAKKSQHVTFRAVWRLTAFVVILLAIVFVIMQITDMIDGRGLHEEQRSREYDLSSYYLPATPLHFYAGMQRRDR